MVIAGTLWLTRDIAQHCPPRPFIRKDAFWNNRFPVILSIENHCSPPQQEVMATLFKREFGECLVTRELGGVPRTQYPSPNELKCVQCL